MEIKQLIFFQAIVKYNSFTEAAEACGISQSGISQQIHSLEKDYSGGRLKGYQKQ